MLSIKKTAVVSVATAPAVVVAVIFATASLAVNTYALTEDQEAEISQSCQTIKQNLKSLQRADSRTRSYLGSLYQTFLTNYISPLNLNLVKNNHPSATITALYSDYLAARQDFATKFTTYSQNFEELLLIDCRKNPDDFYEKLNQTREERTKLHSAVKKLRTILGNQYTATDKLKGELK